jgi:predicted permease
MHQLFNWLDSWFSDIRYALRGLRRSPGFALTVIVTLALGLGVLATSFTVFNAMVLQPFAVRDPYSLYAFIGWRPAKGSFIERRLFSWREFVDFRRENPAFSEVLAYHSSTATVNGINASIQAVTGNYFSMIGGRVCMGRALQQADDESGESVAVANYATWKTRLGADSGIIGKTVQMGEHRLEIVGVACPEFNGPQKENIDFWASLAVARILASSAILFGPPLEGPVQYEIIGRLKPELTQESAEAALLAYGRRTYQGWPGWDKPPEAARLRQQGASLPLDRDTLSLFMPTFFAFGLVLLIACANVSNMVLARGLARQREIGIRISLGARRGRMIRLLLTESVLLAIPAAIAAFGVAHGIIRAGHWLQTNILPASGVREVFGLEKTTMAKIDITSSLPDIRVLLFLFAAALFSTLIFGLAPAIQTTRARFARANWAEFETGYWSARLRNTVVIIQSMLCALLLILGGVAMQNERRIASQDLGFNPNGVFSILMSIKANRQVVVDRLSSLPELDSIGFCTTPPLERYFKGDVIAKLVSDTGMFEGPLAFWTTVSPEFFDVYRIPVRGSKLPSADGQQLILDGSDVIISETLARRLWPSADPLGRTFEGKRKGPALSFDSGHSQRFRVVGIAKDAVHELDESAGIPKPNRMAMYKVLPSTGEFLTMVVRMKGGARTAKSLLLKTLEEATPGEGHFRISAANDQLDKFFYPYRVLVAVAGFLGLVSFFLIVSGIFGMLSYLVTQRRKEYGIRIALGAGRARVMLMVLRQTLQLTVVGSALGLLLSLGVARIMSHYVHAIDFFDVRGYIFGLFIVIVAALAASWIPVRRAVNLDPISTLHCD